MIRLHHIAQARSFRVLWFLHEAGLSHEVVRHSIFDKAIRSPDFLALSPAGRVPAVELDGQTLFESGAILELLTETRAPHLGAAPGDADRARYLEWLHFAETIAVSLAILTQHHIVLREDHMRSPTVMRLEAKRLEKSLQAAARARRGEGVCGAFSAADVALGYGAIIGQKFLRFEDPALMDWLDDLKARPAFQAAMAQDGAAQIYTRDFYEAPHV